MIPYYFCTVFNLTFLPIPSNITYEKGIFSFPFGYKPKQKVKSFVNDITKFDYDFDLVSGRYVIDAKSIMGIFSLDLSKPIDLNIHAEGNTEEVLNVLKPYMI